MIFSFNQINPENIIEEEDSKNIYYCDSTNNSCPKRKECKRYINNNDVICKSTLYKTACNKSNNYMLFISK